MMQLRALMVWDCRDCLARAATIAVRYSAVRRQGAGNPAGKGQNSILGCYVTKFAPHKALKLIV